MKKLDKKQIPQFAALCVLTVGVFGYFVLRLVTPSPAAAGTRPAPPTPIVQVAQAAPAAPTATSASVKVATAMGVPGAAADPAGAADTVPPPSPGMRDPFVVGYVDPKTLPPPAALSAKSPAVPMTPSVPRMARLSPAPVNPPYAAPLPLSGFPPHPGAAPLPDAPQAPALPAPPAAPLWTVTGVVQSDQEQIAILRNGEARRIIRLGDFVDSVYRVVEVTRSSVTLRHGATFYQLTLGAAKAVPVKAIPWAAEPQAALPAPIRPASWPAAPLSFAEAVRSLQKLAETFLAAMPAAPLPIPVSHARDAQPAQVAMRLLDDQTSLTGVNDARAHLEMGLALYQSGRKTDGRAQWQRVLTMDDFDAADEAGKLLGRCP